MELANMNQFNTENPIEATYPLPQDSESTLPDAASTVRPDHSVLLCAIALDYNRRPYFNQIVPEQLVDLEKITGEAFDTRIHDINRILARQLTIRDYSAILRLCVVVLALVYVVVVVALFVTNSWSVVLGAVVAGFCVASMVYSESFREPKFIGLIDAEMHRFSALDGSLRLVWKSVRNTQPGSRKTLSLDFNATKVEWRIEVWKVSREAGSQLGSSLVGMSEFLPVYSGGSYLHIKAIEEAVAGVEDVEARAHTHAMMQLYLFTESNLYATHAEDLAPRRRGPSAEHRRLQVSIPMNYNAVNGRYFSDEVPLELIGLVSSVCLYGGQAWKIVIKKVGGGGDDDWDEEEAGILPRYCVDGRFDEMQEVGEGSAFLTCEMARVPSYKSRCEETSGGNPRESIVVIPDLFCV
ncbi:hypothetical protein HDU98_007606 [Podochytrium sp. JEL0797]|nr:hypothetical protein HDU98_007606 [Podochytrium sp. JEL0797]